MTRRISILTACLALGACAREPEFDLRAPVTRVERQETVVPDAYLQAPAAPPVPGPKATQRMVARYLVDLTRSADTCRINLATTRGILRGARP